MPTAVSPPILPPTVPTENVSTRTKNGPTIARSATGTKYSSEEASSEPAARLKSRHQLETGTSVRTKAQR